MSAMTAQNLNFGPLRTHPLEPFFKMKTPGETLDTDISKSTNTDDLLERIELSDLQKNTLDHRHQRVTRHLSGGGLLLEKKSSYDLSTNPFKNKLRLILAKEEESIPVNPFPSSSPQNELTTPPFILESPKTSQATQTADDVPWLIGDQSEQDLICLQNSMKGLVVSGWYYENVSWKDSIRLLKNTEPGTFFVRDSADPNFLFSLSVQTVRGPTSVRLQYISGRFKLDSDPNLLSSVPSFVSVVELIEYYVEKGKRRRSKINRLNEKVWIDLNGQVYSYIFLSKPLIKEN